MRKKTRINPGLGLCLLAVLAVTGCANPAVEETLELEGVFNELLDGSESGDVAAELRAAVDRRNDYDGMVRAFFGDLADFIAAVEQREAALAAAELNAALLQTRLADEDPRAAKAAAVARYDDLSAEAEAEFERSTEGLIPAVIYGSRELRRFAEWKPDPTGAVGQLLEQLTLEEYLLFDDVESNAFQ